MNLVDRQLELEQYSVTAGIEDYYKTVAGLKSQGLENLTRPVQQLIKRNLSSLADAIKVKQEESEVKVVGKRRSSVSITRTKLLSKVSYESLAVHTLMTVLSRVSKPDNRLNVTALAVSRSIIEEVNFFKFKEENLTSFNITQQHLKKATSQHKKLQIMRKMFQNSNITTVEWSQKDMLQIGTFLIDCLMEVTGLWRTQLVVKNKKRHIILVPTDTLTGWLDEGHEVCSILQPKKLPMLIPPVKWTESEGGGYLTLFNGRKGIINANRSSHIQDLESLDLSNVYEAVNAIQETPWRINKRVLDVARECWNRNIAIGSAGKETLPTQNIIEVPEYPEEWKGKSSEWREVDYEGYKAWSNSAVLAHEANASNTTKRVSSLMKFRIAEMFEHEEAIYFPHSCDFRGRAYPMPTTLTPQGDDLSKGLLQFAEGKALGEGGLRWLHIHAANCFGVDKVSFDDRELWTQDHLEDILDSAMDPLGGKMFWLEADKPFEALAICFELLEYSFKGEDFKSYLPIPQDGSCNGLQNFSALLKDSVGGEATNLMPKETPADIYTEVLQLVNKKVHEDSLEGHEHAILVDGHLSRAIVKQPVMTLPYGATVKGMAAQIESSLSKNKPGLLPRKISWKVCYYLAQVTYDCIGNVVIAARSAMDYLQSMAKIISKSDCPIMWTTPIGMPVVQDYRKPKDQRVEVFIKGSLSKLTVQERGSKLNKIKQKAGIAPNFIHSLDSSHLMLTVLLAKEQGLNSFSMIHDSYGVHACDTDMLHLCLRTAFIEMYSKNILETWTKEVTRYLDPEILKELPEIPKTGTLDLSLILESQYFFA